jgi:hypothetical protein
MPTTQRPQPFSALRGPKTLQADQLSRTQRRALRLTAEQATLPLDQLARLLDCAQANADILVTELEQLGCLQSRQFLEHEERWVWATRRGARVSGYRRGNRPYPPSLRSLNHHRAVAEVRIHLRQQAPRGRWIPEGEIRSRCEPNTPIPDAIFEIDGERHAIEVEITGKTKARTRLVIAHHSAKYDAVIYWSGPNTYHVLNRLKREDDWPKLIIRRLPGARPPRKRTKVARRAPRAFEVGALQLIAEQGAIPHDQLARFLKRDPAEIHCLATSLRHAQLITYERFIVGEPNWAWLTSAGVRLSGSFLSVFRQKPGGIYRLRALNEVRLHVETRSPSARWIGGRQLRYEMGRKGRVPGALVQSGGERHAINVRMHATHVDHLIAQVDDLNRRFDAALFFCANAKVRQQLESLHEQYRWSNLMIRDLPKPVRGVS